MGKTSGLRGFVVLAAAGLLALTGCSSSGPAANGPAASGPSNSTTEVSTPQGAASGSGASGSTAEVAQLKAMLPDSIKSSGVLRDLINAPYPPMEFQAKAGGPYVGIDIDIANAIADLLGLKLKVTNTPSFAAIMPGVQTGRADIAITGIGDYIERQDTVSFVDYFKLGTQFMGLKSKTSQMSSHSDLCGKTVVTQSATSFTAHINEVSKEACAGKQPIKIITLDSPADEVTQVKLGRAIAIVQDSPANSYLDLQHPGTWHVIGDTVNPVTYGIVFAKDKPELGKVMKEAVNVLIANGTYQKILEKWHAASSAVSEATINHGVHESQS